MDISRLYNILNQLGLSKKIEKPGQVLRLKDKGLESVTPGSDGEASDSVSISLEGLIKKIAMEIKEELNTGHQEKINQLKEKIASGEYKVSTEELIRAILEGRDIYEELK